MVKQLSRPGGSPISAMLGVQDAPVMMVPLNDVVVVPGRNPRTLLMTEAERTAVFSRAALNDMIASMRTPLEDGTLVGVLQPLLMRPLADGRYELVAGERRYHAASFAELHEIPVQIRHLTDAEALEAATTENGQREDLDLVNQTYAGFALMRSHTKMSTEQLVVYLNTVRLGRMEDTHGVDELLRRAFGTGISTWSQQRVNVLKLTAAERAALQQGQLDAKALFPLIRLGEHAGRSPLLADLLDLPERPSSQEVRRRVDDLMRVKGDGAASASQVLKALLPRLRKLKPEQQKRVQKLVDQLRTIIGEA